MGFKTFDPFINENYDSEFNIGKRMNMIIDEIERLNSMGFEELKKWYKKLIPTLKHNRKKLIDNNDEVKNLVKILL